MHLKPLAIVAFAAVSPFPANAATVIGDGFFNSYGSVLTGAGSFSREFTASETLKVDLTFSTSGLPTNISLLRYGIDSASEPFTIDTFGDLATGIGSLTDLDFMSGEMFAVLIEPSGALSDRTEVGFSILAEAAPAPIPLPAAGWMLLAGVGGLAVLRRKRAVA